MAVSNRTFAQGGGQRRLVLLDFLRIFCALVIYLRHSITMFGCSYNAFINGAALDYTGFCMTCFFMLSGFSLYYTNANRERVEPLPFYRKRAIALLPTYYLFHLLFLIVKGRGVLADWIYLSPIEALGIQSHFRTFFGILHNGGTWFVSCMLFCYFVYPIIHALTMGSSRLERLTALVVCYTILVYSPYIGQRFGLATNYDNPFFRALEFTCGVMTAALAMPSGAAGRKPVARGRTCLCIAVMACAALPVMLGIFYKGWITSFSVAKTLWLPVPVIALILLAGHALPGPEWLQRSKALKTASAITYPFFLMQLILWDLSTWALQLLGLGGNTAKIAVSFGICTLMSFVIYRFFDQPIRAFFRKRAQKAA